ncbi:hypothetical protein FQA47_017647 [Oryzias melastigma]|uniref:Uncharacterized protein n=1 Tax=Oryzias melastigma TaxID=30732 RepID=A0A834FQP5_ORYME|nr:hypothetical protein FQA47_017647 [Oryzias melastigma]
MLELGRVDFEAPGIVALVPRLQFLIHCITPIIPFLSTISADPQHRTEKPLPVRTGAEALISLLVRTNRNAP